MNYFLRSSIILFSEVIWIYFSIAIFTEVEWGKIIYIAPFWWIIAAVIGYTFNAIFGGRLNYILIIVLNSLLLGFIVVKNWQVVALEGSFVYSLIVTMAVVFTFIRSASFIYIEPTRTQMLLRFEGNVMIYILFSAFYFIKQLENTGFHLVFLFAIFLSLIGMLLTLQSNQIDKEEPYVEVHSIGKSGWFTGVISLLLLGITLLCALFFLPAIRNMLYVAGINSFEGIQWIFQMGSRFLNWFMHLFPYSKEDEDLLFSEPQGPLTQVEEETFGLDVPYGWIIGITSVIGLIVFVWIISKFLKKWQRPITNIPKGQLSFQDSFFSTIKNKIKHFLHNIRKSWKRKFPRYYKQSVYWHYNQLQKWGEKNGFPSLTTETSKEYIEKIVESFKRHLPDNESTVFISQLHELSEDYQQTYFGRESSSYNGSKNYKPLIEQLRNLKGPF